MPWYSSVCVCVCVCMRMCVCVYVYVCVCVCVFIFQLLVFITGDSDPVVSYKFGEMTAEFFKSINCKNHTFNTYKGLVHSSSPQVCFIITTH